MTRDGGPPATDVTYGIDIGGTKVLGIALGTGFDEGADTGVPTGADASADVVAEVRVPTPTGSRDHRG